MLCVFFTMGVFTLHYSRSDHRNDFVTSSSSPVFIISSDRLIVQGLIICVRDVGCGWYCNRSSMLMRLDAERGDRRKG